MRASASLPAWLLLLCTSACTTSKPNEQPEQGLPPDPDAWARVELVPVEGFVRPLTSFGEHVRLPVSRAYEPMSMGAPVVLGKRQAFVDGEVVANLEGISIADADVDGYLITKMLPPLQAWSTRLEEMARAKGEESTGQLLVFADADVSASVLIYTFYTANQAGFRGYELAIDVAAADLPAGVVLSVSPPKFAVTDGAQ